MDFRGRVESFEEADHRYAELSQKREAGGITDEEFDAEAQQLMVRDSEGRWWAKLGDSGGWHYRDGGDWVRGTPPGYEEAKHEGSGSRQSGLRRDETQSMAVAPRPSGTGKGGRRRLPIWIPIAALAGILLLVGVVAFTTLVPLLQSEEASGGKGEGMGVGQSAEEEGGQAGGGSGGGEVSEEVFVHRATSGNISNNSTFIDNPLTNGNPEAVLTVTQNWNPGGGGGTYNDHSVGVWYESGREQWAVFNQDREPMTEDAAFNVAVR